MIKSVFITAEEDNVLYQTQVAGNGTGVSSNDRNTNKLAPIVFRLIEATQAECNNTHILPV